MAHYVCNGCEGVSEVEGVCTTESCAKKGMSLAACDCATPVAHKKADATSAPEAPATEAPATQ
jgi:hypothetical protein